MFELKQTAKFQKWWSKLKDEQARGLISARLNRIAYGNLGDIKSVGGGVSELRIHAGPGYRVYLRRKGITLIILLCGGDKSSQRKDIETAKRIAADWNT
jgi:putative addiction module killer protein